MLGYKTRLKWPTDCAASEDSTKSNSALPIRARASRNSGPLQSDFRLIKNTVDRKMRKLLKIFTHGLLIPCWLFSNYAGAQMTLQIFDPATNTYLGAQGGACMGQGRCNLVDLPAVTGNYPELWNVQVSAETDVVFMIHNPTGGYLRLNDRGEVFVAPFPQADTHLAKWSLVAREDNRFQLFGSGYSLNTLFQLRDANGYVYDPTRLRNEEQSYRQQANNERAQFLAQVERMDRTSGFEKVNLLAGILNTGFPPRLYLDHLADSRPQWLKDYYSESAQLKSENLNLPNLVFVKPSFSCVGCRSEGATHHSGRPFYEKGIRVCVTGLNVESQDEQLRGLYVLGVRNVGQHREWETYARVSYTNNYGEYVMSPNPHDEPYIETEFKEFNNPEATIWKLSDSHGARALSTRSDKPWEGWQNSAISVTCDT
jgi:hypothetical protein